MSDWFDEQKSLRNQTASKYLIRQTTTEPPSFRYTDIGDLEIWSSHFQCAFFSSKKTIFGRYIKRAAVAPPASKGGAENCMLWYRYVFYDTYPHTPVYVTPPPGPIFRGGYLHSSWNSATGAKKKNVCIGKISPRESFPNTYISFGIGTTGTLLVVEQSSLGNRPRGV